MKRSVLIVNGDYLPTKSEFKKFKELSRADYGRITEREISNRPISSYVEALFEIAQTWNLNYIPTPIGFFGDEDAIKIGYRILVNSIKYN
jgi:hypothetical protein